MVRSTDLFRQKRRRREYRQRTKERFKRPELGVSLYEGRTRGKRVKYTYSDEEDDVFSDATVRRSARNTGTSTPVEQVTTQSGRQVRPPTRLNRDGESAPGSVQGDTPDTNSKQEDLVGANGRPTRAAARARGANGRMGQDEDSMGDNDEDEPSEPDYGDSEGDDEHVPHDSNEEEESDEEELLDEDLDVQGDRKLVVKLAVDKTKLQGVAAVGLPSPVIETADVDMSHDVDMKDAPAEDKATGVDLPRQPTPEPTINTNSEKNGSRTPAAEVTETSLAFRGSPEKPQAPQPAPVDAQ